MLTTVGLLLIMSVVCVSASARTLYFAPPDLLRQRFRQSTENSGRSSRSVIERLVEAERSAAAVSTLQSSKTSALQKLEFVNELYRDHHNLAVENLERDLETLCRDEEDYMNTQQLYEDLSELRCLLRDNAYISVATSPETGLVSRLAAELNNMACLLYSECQSFSCSNVPSLSAERQSVNSALRHIIQPMNRLLRCTNKA